MIWVHLTKPQDSDFRPRVSHRFSPLVIPSIMGKHHGEKKEVRNEKLAVTQSFCVQPSLSKLQGTQLPPPNTPVHTHTCTHCYGARAPASAPCLRAGSYLSFPASSPVGRYTYHSNHFFICIFLLKKGPRWARYYSLSISSVNFKSPLCPLCSPRTDAASSHTSLPHRQLMKLHS